VKFSHGRSWFRHEEDFERHTRLEKREKLLDAFVSCLVIGVYSAINDITGFILI
jgi:hypothetical protein